MALRDLGRSIGFSFLTLLLVSACATPGRENWMIGFPVSFADEDGPTAGPPTTGTYVTTAAVAFRDGASSGVRIIAVLPPGTIVNVDGRSLFGWWGIDYQGVSGWIYSANLQPQ